MRETRGAPAWRQRQRNKHECTHTFSNLHTQSHQKTRILYKLSEHSADVVYKYDTIHMKIGIQSSGAAFARRHGLFHKRRLGNWTAKQRERYHNYISFTRQTNALHTFTLHTRFNTRHRLPTRRRRRSGMATLCGARFRAGCVSHSAHSLRRSSVYLFRFVLRVL